MSDNTEVPVRNIDIIPNTYVRIDMPANINLLVGNPPAAGWDQLDKQFKIMLGEWNELVKNFNEKNYEGLVDDTQDLLFTLIGFSHAAGFMPDFAENFHRVCDSQFNKFDTTPEGAEKTKAKYEAQGMVVVTEVVQLADSCIYITKSAIEQNNPGRNESIPAGKWLKSHLFTEPTLIVPQHPIFDIPAIKNAVGRTSVNITLDEEDPNPSDTVEKLMHSFVNGNSARYAAIYAPTYPVMADAVTSEVPDVLDSESDA